MILLFVSNINPSIYKNRKRFLKQGFGEFKCLGINLWKSFFSRLSWNWKLKGTLQPDNNIIIFTVKFVFHYSLLLLKNTIQYYGVLYFDKYTICIYTITHFFLVWEKMYLKLCKNRTVLSSAFKSQTLTILNNINNSFYNNLCVWYLAYRIGCFP